MKSKLSLIVILATSILVISATSLTAPDNQANFLDRHAALAVREIGHKLLLLSGDSTSRILPVSQLSRSIFQLEFQNKFSFMPDSLVQIVQHELQSTTSSIDYLVNVFDCSTNKIVYGFAIKADDKDIVPCLGRAQPNGCYYIQIAFLDSPDRRKEAAFYPTVPIVALGASLIFVIISLFWNRDKQVAPIDNNESIALGKYCFESDRKTLRLGSETIVLSDKEAKLLTLFAANKNQLIDRDHLLKEVWENEGVFTGRSLDMFVSRLRKKLIKDTCVRLSNIHGKGYKLEIR